MRIGLIGDIHGNLFALETVLAELEREPLDQLICLGDVVALGPQPGGVLARLRALGCPVVMGNTDAWLLDRPSASVDEIDRAFISWTSAQLTASDRAYVAAFPNIHEQPLGAG
jgi:predicted phosphodiesterase